MSTNMTFQLSLVGRVDLPCCLFSFEARKRDSDFFCLGLFVDVIRYKTMDYLKAVFYLSSGVFEGVHCGNHWKCRSKFIFFGDF